MEHHSHTASLASGEELDCNYVTTIPVVMIIRYGCTPVGDYELGGGARRNRDMMRSQE